MIIDTDKQYNIDTIYKDNEEYFICNLKILKEDFNKDNKTIQEKLNIIQKLIFDELIDQLDIYQQLSNHKYILNNKEVNATELWIKLKPYKSYYMEVPETEMGNIYYEDFNELIEDIGVYTREGWTMYIKEDNL